MQTLDRTVPAGTVSFGVRVLWFVRTLVLNMYKSVFCTQPLSTRVLSNVNTDPHRLIKVLIGVFESITGL